MNSNQLTAAIKKQNRFRVTFAAGDMATEQPRISNIDEEKGLLSSVQICLEGEAKGHGVFLPPEFIDGLAEQGNAYKLGMKVRFGHPGMCSDALGTYLGRASNFKIQDVTRKDGTTCKGCFADIQLAQEAKKAPAGDLYTWTLETAKNSPDTFGQSIVFNYADFYVVGEDGTHHLWSAEDHESDKAYDSFVGKSADKKVYAMLAEFLGTDFTDSPAATDGVFSSDQLASQATEFLDEHPEVFRVLGDAERIEQFLTRYNNYREAQGLQKVAMLSIADLDPQGRLSKLQATKDKEIAALAEKFSADKKEFEGKLSALQAELDKANALLSTSNEKLAKAETELGLVTEQLSAAKEAHAKLTGAVLKPGGSNREEFATFEDAKQKIGYAAARNDYPELFADYQKRLGMTK